MTLTTDTDRTDTGATHHQEPGESSNPKRQWLLVAAVIAVLGLVAGLVFIGNRADEEPVPADEPEPTAPEATVQEEPAAEPEAVPLAQFEEFGPGTYETTLLGVPLTFDTDEGWSTVFFQTGELLFLNPDFETAGVRSWRVTRLGGWHTTMKRATPSSSSPLRSTPTRSSRGSARGTSSASNCPTPSSAAARPRSTTSSPIPTAASTPDARPSSCRASSPHRCRRSRSAGPRPATNSAGSAVRVTRAWRHGCGW